MRVLGIFLILGTAGKPRSIGTSRVLGPIKSRSPLPANPAFYCLALGIVDTTHSCMHTHRSSVALASGNLNSTFPVGTLYQGDGTGMATCVISLVTNIAATALIAYKAWYVLHL